MSSAGKRSNAEMTEAGLAEALRGRPFRFYPSVESTNSVAVKWVKAGPPPASGSVVVADEQTAGRGRFNRRWMTPAGTAVAMSVILRCEEARRPAPAAGLAVAETVSPLVEAEVGLKWPNDVEIAGEKVAGILIESVSASPASSVSAPMYVVGIGINVEESYGEGTVPLSQALGRRVTSLSHHYRPGLEDIPRETLIADIADRLETRVADPELMSRWKERLTTIGMRVRVAVFDGTVEGTALDVDEDGCLVVRDDDGGMHHLCAGDVSISTALFDKNC